MSTGTSAGETTSGQEDELPAAQLRAVDEVEVLGERVVLPAAGVGDALRRQMPAVPLKLKKRPERLRAVCSMTKWPSSKMRLRLGEDGVVAVEVPPAHLHHADLRVGEEGHRALEEVRGRDEVGVEDRDELALGQRSGHSRARPP